MPVEGRRLADSAGTCGVCARTYIADGLAAQAGWFHLGCRGSRSSRDSDTAGWYRSSAELLDGRLGPRSPWLGRSSPGPSPAPRTLMARRPAVRTLWTVEGHASWRVFGRLDNGNMSEYVGVEP